MPASSSAHPALPAAMQALERLRTPRDLANLARFGITATNPLGVSMANIQTVARRLGRDHDLAAALWATGVYEARLLTAYVDDPAQVTVAQMDRWCRDFDNWGVCDTLCFSLFDRTAKAWSRVDAWAPRRAEFVRRAAFALMASKAVHDKTADDALFLDRLTLVEAAADDERPLVRKGVSWALRTTGRRNVGLHQAALALARRLAESPDAGARRVGRDAVRELTGPIVTRVLEKTRTRAARLRRNLPAS
jgi:3-methyladenine DNA glycosylase AlkD